MGCSVDEMMPWDSCGAPNRCPVCRHSKVNVGDWEVDDGWVFTFEDKPSSVLCNMTVIAIADVTIAFWFNDNFVLTRVAAKTQ